jgi:sulfur carrier protein
MPRVFSSKAMNIIVNGSPRNVPDDLSASELILALGLASKRLAVEVNEEIVPRSRLETWRLSPGDRVEIVHAIGGG